MLSYLPTGSLTTILVINYVYANDSRQQTVELLGQKSVYDVMIESGFYMPELITLQNV